MSYYGDDDYDYERRRRPSPHRYRSDRRTTQLLSPDFGGGGLHRSRSQGQAPVPVVNVYNDILQDGHFRNTSVSPPYSPSSEHRGRRLGSGSDFAEEFASLAMENQRLRSRSRGRSDAGALARPDPYLEYELRDRERRLREIERKEEQEREEQRLKDKYDNQKVRDDAKRRADEDDAKAEKQRIIEDYERKQREAKDEAKRMREQVEREQQEEKDRAKKEWEAFCQKQKAEEEKKKAEEKAQKEELEEEMRNRLMKHGYTWAQAEKMISDKKEETVNRTTTLTTTTRSFGDGSLRPTYAKIKKEYISVDTLRYYDIPYEYDQDDDRYIIILREMDKYETDVLFEHTRRLRAGKLLLEPPKKEKEYAWYRKRDRSTSRVRKVGILEYKK